MEISDFRQPAMKNVRVVIPPESDEVDELRHLVSTPSKNRKRLSKQLSMRETSREAAWEKRRHQILSQERRMGFYRFEESVELDGFSSPRLTGRSLTDEDLDELKGCIDLGFGFNEEDGQNLCNTLPALDLYFAINRNLSDSKLSDDSTPDYSSAGRSSSVGSPRSPQSEIWKICNPGDNPLHVKTRLRHWAQAVACSVRQSC